MSFFYFMHKCFGGHIKIAWGPLAAPSLIVGHPCFDKLNNLSDSLLFIVTKFDFDKIKVTFIDMALEISHKNI